MTSSSGVWHFFFLDLLVSKPKKYRQLSLRKVILGPDGPDKGHMFHATITKNTWYARILDRKTIDRGSSNDIKNGMLRY